MDERIKLLEEQNKSLQERVQEKDSKIDAMEKQQMNFSEEQIEALLQAGRDKLYYSHTSGSNIQLDNSVGGYRVVCPSCSYRCGWQARYVKGHDYEVFKAIIGRGLHVGEDNKEFTIPGVVALSQTPLAFDRQPTIGNIASRRCSTLYGREVHCPLCAYMICLGL